MEGSVLSVRRVPVEAPALAIQSLSLRVYRISIMRQVSGSNVSMTGRVVDSGPCVPLLVFWLLGFSFAMKRCQRLFSAVLLGVAIDDALIPFVGCSEDAGRLAVDQEQRVRI